MPGNAAPSFTTNANELVAKLNSMGDKVEDPQALLENVRQVLQGQEFQVFATEGAALGEVWKGLVQPERKDGGRVLIDTGAMMESVAGDSAGTIRGATLRIHPKPFYSRWHQFGTATMDARPFTGISDASMRLILQEFERATGEVLGA